MQDPFPNIPSCFSGSVGSIGKFPTDPTSALAATKSGQSVVASVYRTKIAGHSRLITVTWCRNVLAHGLCVCVEGSDRGGGDSEIANPNTCKVELRPWYFWRKTGSKKFDVQGKAVQVFWDLRHAKFCGEPEPRANFYVAVAHDDEVVLLLGDSKDEAYRRTRLRPAAIEATLVSKKEHVFGKKRFATRSKFGDKGKVHDIVIECGVSGSGAGKSDPEMVMKIDGNVVVHVKHLQWKFRGNETIVVSKARVEVYWDVHDWLFSPGVRHALFIFKPLPTPHSSVITTSSMAPMAENDGSCLFLYAWKLE